MVFYYFGVDLAVSYEQDFCSYRDRFYPWESAVLKTPDLPQCGGADTPRAFQTTDFLVVIVISHLWNSLYS